MKKLDALLHPWLQLLLVAIFGCTLISLLIGGYAYPGLFTHFKVHYVVVLVFLMGYMGLTHRWGRLSLAGLALVLNLVDITHLYQSPEPVRVQEAGEMLALHTSDWVPTDDAYAAVPIKGGNETLQLYSANLLRSNTEYDAVIAQVQAESPDVVILLEATHTWAENLQPLIEAYPYSFLKPQDDYFGILMMSRFPIVDREVLYLCDVEVPTLHAVLQVGAHRVSVVGTHPPAPPLRNEIRWRNQQLEGLACLAAARTRPFVVAGDLNLTSFHPYFKFLLREGNLKDSRRGFGVQPTWPVKVGPLGITLDHCLTSEEWQVLDRKVLPAVGSDHAPILLDLALGE